MSSSFEHNGFMCDVCKDDLPIKGIRYSCKVCEDFDLCQEHFATLHSHHDCSHGFLEYRKPGIQSGRSVHEGYKCVSCGEDPIEGIRFHCKSCEDFDFCEKCFFVGYQTQKSVSHAEGHAFDPIFAPVPIKSSKKMKVVKKVRLQKLKQCKRCGSKESTIFKCQNCKYYYLCSQHYKTFKNFHTKTHKFRKISNPKTTPTRQEKKKNEPQNQPLTGSVIRLSYDVLGHMLTFNRSSGVLFRMLSTCKGIRKYLSSVRPQSSENVQFILKKTPKMRKLPYVYRLEVKEVKISDTSLTRFTNLKHLTLIQCKGLGFRGIVFPDSFTKSIETLKLENCTGIKSKELKKLRRVRAIRVENSYISSGSEYDLDLGECISFFKRLERLHLLNVQLKLRFFLKLESIAPQIRKLVLTRRTENSNRWLPKMVNLESLELNDAWNISPNDFTGLKKLRKLVLKSSQYEQIKFTGMENLRESLEMVEVEKRVLRRLRGSIAM